MDDSIDTRIITEEWLAKRIPLPRISFENNKFEVMGTIKLNEIRKQVYLKWRNNLNQAMTRSGHDNYNDAEIREFIDSQDGTFYIPRTIK